jgi:hypothetical protein
MIKRYLAERILGLVLNGDRERAVGLARTFDMESLDSLRVVGQALAQVAEHARLAKLRAERVDRWKSGRNRRREKAL